MTCVTSPTYSLAINGGIHGFIHGKRGLRQGHPMSPALFLLCMEYLSRLLNKRTKELDFSFHPKCDILQISHIAFADDLLLFGRGDVRSMRILDDALRMFSDQSGLNMNKNKSTIYMGGVVGFEKELIMELFGYPMGELPTKYLGLPLASRLELARSVIQGIQCFWMQAIPLPSTIIDRITSLIRRFLWGVRPAQSLGRRYVNQRRRGRGLRDLTALNKALLTKVLWNIHSKADSLWVRWVHGEYLKSKSIWEVTPSTRDSPTIKNVLSIRDKILTDNNGCRTNAIAMITKWFETNGTAAAYEHVREKGNKLFWNKFIWKSFIPPRWSLAIWKALHGRLQTADRLDFLDIPKVCPLCHVQPESHTHLFFQCRKTLAVWSRIWEWIKIQRQMTSIPSAIKYIHKEKNNGSGVVQKARMLAITTAINHLWRARNLAVFDKVSLNVLRLTNEIKREVYAILYSLSPPYEKVREHLDDVIVPNI